MVRGATNYGAREAAAKNVVDIVAPTLPALLDRIDGRVTQPKGSCSARREPPSERVSMSFWPGPPDTLPPHSRSASSVFWSGRDPGWYSRPRRGVSSRRVSGTRVLFDPTEKPHSSEDWINGGFMVCEPQIFDFLEGDGSSLEADALVKLAAQGQLAAYRHHGFWQCMDSLRDRRLLDHLWESGNAPWKVWP